jgi:hypothetical protein
MSDKMLYKSKKMRLTVNHGGLGYILGVVEGYDMELLKEGGVVPFYDSETGRHAVGTRHATFRLRRFFKADTNQTALLMDLFHSETHFNLTGELNVSGIGGSSIMLSDCLIYSYGKPGGTANDIIVEEARGEATDWVKGVTD